MHRLWKGKLLFFCRVGVPPPRLKTETDPVSETLCFLFVEIRTMDKVQKLNSNEKQHILYIYRDMTVEFQNSEAIAARQQKGRHLSLEMNFQKYKVNAVMV
jgi:hypothetical protein